MLPGENLWGICHMGVLMWHDGTRYENLSCLSVAPSIRPGRSAACRWLQEAKPAGHQRNADAGDGSGRSKRCGTGAIEHTSSGPGNGSRICTGCDTRTGTGARTGSGTGDSGCTRSCCSSGATAASTAFGHSSRIPHLGDSAGDTGLEDQPGR